MSGDVQSWLWFGGGLALLATELVSIHLVAGFLGAGALLVAGARWLGLVESTTGSIALWGVSSAALLAILRGTLVRWAGKPEVHRAQVSEDVRAFGSVVEVVAEVSPREGGRIRYDGTSWPAISTNGSTIAAGRKARLVRRENLAWVVEQVGEEAVPLLPPEPKED